MKKTTKSLKKNLVQTGFQSINFGGWGETQVKSLCQELEWITTPIGDDRNGWDILASIPDWNETSFPMDRRHLSTYALFQVKTVENDNFNRSINISLTNWEKLIKAPMASFIIILGAKKNNPGFSLQRLAIIHIDQEIINKVQNKLRNYRGKTDNLHKLSMSIPKKNLITINDPDCRKFGSLIEKLLSASGSEYYDKKLKWLNENGINKFSFKSVINLSEMDKIIDFAIGKENSIDVKDLKLESDVKFGVASEMKEIPSAKFTIADRPSIPGSIVMMTNDGAYSVVIESKYITPNFLLSNIQKEHYRTRMIGGSLDVLIHWGRDEVNFNLHIELNESLRITNHKWREILFPYLIIYEGKRRGGITIHIKSFSDNEKLNKTFQVTPEMLSSLNTSDAMIEDARAIEGLEIFSILAGHEISISPKELAENHYVFQFLQKCCGIRDRNTLCITIKKENNNSEGINILKHEGKVIALPFFDFLNISGGKFGISGALFGVPFLINDSIRIRTPECIMFSIILPTNGEQELVERKAKENLASWIQTKTTQSFNILSALEIMNALNISDKCNNDLQGTYLGPTEDGVTTATIRSDKREDQPE